MLSRWPRSRAVFVWLLHVISGPVSPGQCRVVSSAASMVSVDTAVLWSSCVRVQEVPRKQLSVGKIRAAELPIVWVLGNNVQYPHCRLTIGPRWAWQWEGQPVRDSGLQEELQTYLRGWPSQAWGKCLHYLTRLQELRNNALNNWPIRILQLFISERTTKQLAFGQLSFLRKHTDLTALVPCPTAQWTLKLGFAIHAPRLLM